MCLLLIRSLLLGTLLVRGLVLGLQFLRLVLDMHNLGGRKPFFPNCSLETWSFLLLLLSLNARQLLCRSSFCLCRQSQLLSRRTFTVTKRFIKLLVLLVWLVMLSLLLLLNQLRRSCRNRLSLLLTCDLLIQFGLLFGLARSADDSERNLINNCITLLITLPLWQHRVRRLCRCRYLHNCSTLRYKRCNSRYCHRFAKLPFMLIICLAPWLIQVDHLFLDWDCLGKFSLLKWFLESFLVEYLIATMLNTMLPELLLLLLEASLVYRQMIAVVKQRYA
mmetsp:Transcript_140318/g.364727  ORF Transcript_140318/g.364727 Transcript_140318/m.364727 type:complete len:277 (+) Transcript_140318:193-1023(+)